MSPLASLTDRQELFVVTEERDAIAMQVIDENGALKDIPSLDEVKSPPTM